MGAAAASSMRGCSTRRMLFRMPEGRGGAPVRTVVLSSSTPPQKKRPCAGGRAGRGLRGCRRASAAPPAAIRQAFSRMIPLAGAVVWAGRRRGAAAGAPRHPAAQTAGGRNRPYHARARTHTTRTCMKRAVMKSNSPVSTTSPLMIFISTVAPSRPLSSAGASPSSAVAGSVVSAAAPSRRWRAAQRGARRRCLGAGRAAGGWEPGCGAAGREFGVQGAGRGRQGTGPFWSHRAAQLAHLCPARPLPRAAPAGEVLQAEPLLGNERSPEDAGP